MSAVVLSRWQSLQMRSLNPHPTGNTKYSPVDSTTISFCLGPSLNRGCMSSTSGLTSISIFTNAIGRSIHEKRRARLGPKQENFSCKGSSAPSNDPPIFEASSMDEIYDTLAYRLLQVATTSQPNAKYIVGLAGPPGAGKSTVANAVACRLNVLWRQRASTMVPQIEPADLAIVVPMDGFHLYRSQLDIMEDPKEAHARRGAPWTFDPARLISCLVTLRRQGFVYAPSFDHAVGDPVEDDVFVSPLHKIVLVEGNYLLLEEGLWRDLASLFDERWFLEVDINATMQRVKKRHISVGNLPEVANWRVEYNDRPNAELIAKSRKNADLVICSVEYST